MKKVSFLMLAVLCLCVSMANAQQQQVLFKDTIWVPVTYYDFHSNKSNPEFEVTPNPIEGGVRLNMVGQKLDSEGKPVLGTTPYVDQYIKYWFRPWAGTAGSAIHAKGDSTIPVYDLNDNFVNVVKVNTDTAFKNIVFHDSLPFVLVRGAGVPGTYQYSNLKFFPLDGKGFGNESNDENGNPHNYSFAMEMKWPFDKRGSQTFDFEGDDDVWAFVNGQLAMDVGGIHGPQQGHFSMDQFPSIQPSSVCTLSVFYTERHVTGSDIKITTNIISPKLNIKVSPDSTICVGDSVIASASITRGSEVLTQIPKGCSLKWSLSDPINSPSTFSTIGSNAKFVPTKATTAKITGTLYDSINNIYINSVATIYVKLCIGPPDTMKFYDAPGDPKSMTPLKDTITVVAGKHQNVYAKLFDSLQHSWLSQYEQVDSLANRFKWTLSDTTFKDSVEIQTKGSHVDFFSKRAYKYPVLTATYPANRVLRHTIVIQVIPDTPKVLVIEPNPNGKTASPNFAQLFPNNTISMQSNETVIKAYAVLRDQYMNYCYPSNPTSWSIDKPIASLANGDATLGEVTITRIDSGLTVVHATDTKTSLQGSANLNIVNYYYKELKVTVKQKIAAKDTLLPVDSLVMNTNQDTIFYVIGLRSDNNQWEQTSANWEISKPLLGGNLSAVPGASSYPVSPTKPDIGWVRITKGNDSLTKPDTVAVVFTPGPAIKAEITIVNPSDPNKSVAGEPIYAVVKIYNKDGLVPGDTCFSSAIYQDTLGKKGGFEPTVTIDTVTDTINQLPSKAHSTSECFSNGLDTIKIVLYNAPVAPDSVHKIFVQLGNLQVAYTDPFHLNPGKIDRLDIENADGSSVQDPVILNAPDSSKMFYAAGFDHYGNRIPGWTLSNWSVSGNLNPINGQNVGQIYYETGSVKINESGYLTASVSDTIKDSVFMKINGPAINLTRAITRDLGGNGYLDHIELHFEQPVTLPANFSFSGLSIINGSTTFTAAGIENNTGRTDSVWSIKINEVQNSIPQTAWKPYITFNRDNTYSIAGANKVQCQDGAGPVVWYVVDTLGKAKDHTEDVVTVTFSEPVLRSSGTSLALSDTPSVVFYVWEKNPNDSFVIIEKILVGINTFTTISTTTKDPKQSVVSFKMTNKNDITSNYFMSINTDKMYISDNAQPQNFPNLNNQKVRVNVVPPPIHWSSAPNPGSPDSKLVVPGALSAEHNPFARSYLSNGGKGTISTAILYIPPDGIKVRCYRKFYDAVGNLVNQAKTEDLLKQVPKDVSSFPIDLYWNEYTAQKSKAAPGVYMEVIYIEYYPITQSKVSNNQAKIFNDKIQQGQYPFVIMHGVGK